MENNFGQTLRRIRLERGLSQEDLGKLLGTSKQVISRYENGTRIPKITIAKKYSDILGIPFESLLDESSAVCPSGLTSTEWSRVQKMRSAPPAILEAIDKLLE